MPIHAVRRRVQSALRPIAMVCVLGLGLLVAACGGDTGSNPTEGGSAGMSGSPEPGMPDCRVVALPQMGKQEELRIVAAIPAGTGGSLTDGEYELLAHTRYATAAREHFPTIMRAALRLRQGGSVMDYAFVEDDGDLPDSSAQRWTASVTTQGPTLQLSMICPSSRQIAVSYTAQANELSLFEGNEEMRFGR